ncbi:hypothetical protein ACFL6N_02015 [Thermodesulfobacteriota bacterium]
MEKNRTFTEFEKVIQPMYFHGLENAKSTEEIRVIFNSAVMDFFKQTLSESVIIDERDIQLDLSDGGGFLLSRRLYQNEDFMKIWRNSDLLPILYSMAEFALNRNQHFHG